MLMERLITGGLLALLLLSPLPFGSVEEEWSSVLTAGTLLLAALWVIWRVRRRISAFPWRDPLLIGGLLFAALGTVQTLPMPPGLLARLSPDSVAIRSEFGPGPRLADPGSPDMEEEWKPVSVYPWATRHSVLRTLAYLLAALMALDLASAGAGRRALAWGLVAGGLFQAIYGLWEYVSGHQHIFGYPKIHAIDVATGTFINRNHLAGYLEMTLPFAVALSTMLWARARAAGAGSGIRRLASTSGRQLCAATSLLMVALIMTTALICSHSRMGMVSALLSLLVVGIYATRQGGRRGFTLAAVVLAGVTVLVFGQAGVAPVIERFLAAPEHLSSGIGRWSIWSQVLPVFTSFPILGVGMGAFPYVFASFRTMTPGVALTHAHNDYLEAAAETGWAGCAVLAVALFLLLRSLFRGNPERAGFGHLGHAAAAGVIAIALHSIADFNLAIPSNALTFAVVLGLLVAWRRAPVPILAASRPETGRWVWRSAPGVLLLAAAAALAAAPVMARAAGQTGLASVFHLADGDNALRLKELAAARSAPAIEDLGRVMAEAGEGRFHSPEVLSYLRERLSQAILVQEEGLRHLPLHPSSHLSLGRLKAARCSVDALTGADQGECVKAVLADFQRAIRLNPMGARIHAKVARFYLRAWPLLQEDSREKALEVIAKALAMNPGDEELRRASAAVPALSS